jgi:hypothetical protein
MSESSLIPPWRCVHAALQLCLVGVLLTASAAVCAGVIVVPPPGAPPAQQKAGSDDLGLEVDRYVVSPGRWQPVVSSPGKPAQLMIGTRLRVCATPPQDGELSLEEIGSAGGKPLYPPQDAQDAQGGRDRPLSVLAGVRICLGEGADAQLRVGRPLGRTQLRCVFRRALDRGLAGAEWLIEFDAVAP